MSDIIYKPSFAHTDWVDNEDVVQAGGENGFNKRFNTLADDSKQLTSVIAQINAAIVPVNSTVPLSFAPAFLPEHPSPPWDLASSIAVSGGTAAGWMPVQLPHGTKIQSLTVIGDITGPMLFAFDLTRLSFPSALVSIAKSQFAGPGPFRVSPPIIADDSGLVDNTVQQYSISARVVKIGSADGKCSIFGFLISCSRS